MEYVDGVNLWQLEQTQKKIAPEQALVIVPKICDALQYAHDEGVVHRDIKPANILLDAKGRVKIADFGIAKLVGKASEPVGLTHSRMTIGTLNYMAPEQMERPLEVDHRADIYSLGVVLYEMLTGELPLGRFASPSEKVQVDVRLDEVVLRSLERDVERRYQHVSDVKTALEDVAGITAKLPATAKPDGATQRYFVQTLLWLVVIIGALIGAAFQRGYGPAYGPNGVFLHQRDFIKIGAVDPWYVYEMARPEPNHSAGGHSGVTFNTWSFLAIIVSFVTAEALWRMRREDSGKLRRDPASWRRWWIRSGLVVFIFFAATIARTLSHAAKPKFLQTDPAETTRIASSKPVAFDWQKLADEGGLLGGEAMSLEGRTVLKIENTNSTPLQLSLFKIVKPSITSMTYAVTGELKCENVSGDGYLEMWSYFPPLEPGQLENQFFSGRTRFGTDGENHRHLKLARLLPALQSHGNDELAHAFGDKYFSSGQGRGVSGAG